MDSLRLKEREGKGSLLGILRNWICISRYALMGGIKAGKIMVFIASGPLYRSQICQHRSETSMAHITMDLARG